MTALANSTFDVPVRKTITVNATPQRAFQVFTEGIDTWWPREHHIGSVPMKRVIVEGRAGGRCYTEQTDGSECDWGIVLEWDPPHRLVMAWQINGQWKYEPEVARSSEVEVRFTPQGDGSTRVDLEHRHFERLGAAGETMRAMVDSPNGWNRTFELYAARVEQEASR